MSARRVVGACGLGALLALGPATTHPSAAQAPSDGALVDLHRAVIVDLGPRDTARAQGGAAAGRTGPEAHSGHAAGPDHLAGSRPHRHQRRPHRHAARRRPGIANRRPCHSGSRRLPAGVKRHRFGGSSRRGRRRRARRALRRRPAAARTAACARRRRAGAGPASVDDATNAPARTSARLPAQDQLVRRLDRRDVGAVHRRSGGIRHQRD